MIVEPKTHCYGWRGNRCIPKSQRVLGWTKSMNPQHISCHLQQVRHVSLFCSDFFCVFLVQNLNVFLGLNCHPMNRKCFSFLRVRKSAKLSTSILLPFVNFGKFSPPHRRVLGLPHQFITKSQSAGNNPQLIQSRYVLSLCVISLSLQLFGCSPALRTCTRAPMQTRFPSLFFLPKSKGKRTPSQPYCFPCEHAQGCHVTHSSGRRTTSLKVGPNFTSDDIPTDHFHCQKMLFIIICTLLHIISICPRL